MSAPRERLERDDPPALTPGLCDFCGASIKKGRNYCSTECARAYDAVLIRQGRALAQWVKIWRKHRGRKDTPGKTAMEKLAKRTDAFLDEDRTRQAIGQGAKL